MHTKFGYIQKKFRTNNIKKLDKKILYGNIQIPYVMFTHAVHNYIGFSYCQLQNEDCLRISKRA